MGNRANVQVIDGKSNVFLYTHWDGDSLPIILRDALRKGKDRWNDSQYLARIIFCEMIGADFNGLTGYGISSVVGDGDDRILKVDVGYQTVTWAGSRNKFMSFAEYAAKGHEPVWK